MVVWSRRVVNSSSSCCDQEPLGCERSVDEFQMKLFICNAYNEIFLIVANFECICIAYVEYSNAQSLHMKFVYSIA